VCPTDIPKDQIKKILGDPAYTECEYFDSSHWRENAMWRAFPDIQSLHNSKLTQLNWLNTSLSESKKVLLIIFKA
jgi:hypothetical protein